MHQPPGTHLAQINIGRLIAEPGHPSVAPFIAAIDRINALGERSPGFVWRMQGSGEPNTGNTEAAIGGDPRVIANLTVWTDVASLAQFAYNTVHRQFYERRGQWFAVMDRPHFAMRWVPVGHRPTLEEALAKLELIARDGDSPEAFGWAAVADAVTPRRCEGAA